jgi:hypothetical protein
LNDLNDKNSAFSIDEENLALNRYSSAISFKPNPLRIPKEYVFNFNFNYLMKFLVKLKM